MFKNFGYLLLFFFALNFTAVDAQLEYDCDKKALSQEQIVECQYEKKKILKYQEEDWTKNLKSSDIHDITKSSSSGELEENTKKVKESESTDNVVEGILMLNKLLSGNLDYPDIPVEKRSGLNMFDEESAGLIMKCWDSHQGNWLTFEKVDDTIWRRLNDGPRTLPAKILESDDNAKKYYAPISTIIGKIDVVLDFKKKILQQKNEITGVERISCR